jgi:hypothetical protein
MSLTDLVERRGPIPASLSVVASCVIKGGVLSSYSLGRISELEKHAARGELTFVQISDSHMGFDKAANPDVVSTFKAAVNKINALPASPAFILHTAKPMF